MGLRSVSASKDVIGNPSRPGTNNNELLEPRREEREKVLGNRTSFHFNRAGKKRVAYGGKKCVFRPEKCGIRSAKEIQASMLPIFLHWQQIKSPKFDISACFNYFKS